MNQKTVKKINYVYLLLTILLPIALIALLVDPVDEEQEAHPASAPQEAGAGGPVVGPGRTSPPVCTPAEPSNTAVPSAASG